MKKLKKVLISALPFAELEPKILNRLEKKKLKILFCKKNQISKFLPQCNYYIAGTEKISDDLLNRSTRLEFISRVGIGLDNLNLKTLKKKSIGLSYTPDAQSQSVAEFTVGLAISLLRNIHLSNLQNRKIKWSRPYGYNFEDINFGIIGFGRIGSKVYSLIKNMGFKNIFVNDIDKKKAKKNCKSLNYLLKNSDLITFHIPMNKKNQGIINKKLIMKMIKKPFLINTSRGGISIEKDILDAIENKKIKGIALDVFPNEPKINNKLLKHDNVILTSHIAAMTKRARLRMEVESIDSICKFIENKKDYRRII